MPQDAQKRDEWIKKIKSHQNFTAVDENSVRFTVCSEHFEATQLQRTKGRIIPGCPTIFPPHDEILPVTTSTSNQQSQHKSPTKR